MERKYYGEYKPDVKFVFLCCSQMIAILIFFISGVALQLEKERFSEVTEFQSVEAYNVNGIYGISNYWRYDDDSLSNKYFYDVNNHRYYVTFLSELNNKEYQTIYYNPNNPDICSKYSNYSNTVKAYVPAIILGIILQIVVIINAVQGAKKVNESEGIYNRPHVVIYDSSENMQVDHWTEDKTDNDIMDESSYSDGKTVTEEKESIPFTRPLKISEKVVLYTEEEYKKLKKENKNV